MTEQAPPFPGDQYLTRREAAEMMRVSTWTLDAWAREPDFPMMRLGKRVRFIPKQPFIEWVHRFAEQWKPGINGAERITAEPPPSSPRRARRK